MKQEWIESYIDSLDKKGRLKYYRDCINMFIIDGEIFEKDLSDKDAEFILTKSPKFNFSDYLYSLPFFKILEKLNFSNGEEEIYIPIQFIDVLMDKIKEENLKPNKRETTIIDNLLERQVRVQDYVKSLQLSTYNLDFSIKKNDIFYKVLYKYNIPFIRGD